jgi:hypothetical protein
MDAYVRDCYEREAAPNKEKKMSLRLVPMPLKPSPAVDPVDAAADRGPTLLYVGKGFAAAPWK